MDNEELKFRQTAFAVFHQIEDCPPFMAIRELTVNAIEAVKLINPPGSIGWFKTTIDGIPKIGLFNEGPGMSADALWRLMDLASTSKELGSDRNYGQGAKVACLKISPAGVIYRSCHQGQVCQIVLCMETRSDLDYPVAVKKRYRIEDEQGESFEVVLDVTDEYQGRMDRPLNRDWTEVILLGSHPGQNTVESLIPGISGKNWLMRLIHTRFFRFPEGVVVKAANITTGQPNLRDAAGMESVVLRWSDRHEDVVAEHPELGVVLIRYCKLKGSYGTDDPQGHSRAKTLEAYGIGTRGDHVCMVWKNECFDIRTGWSRIAGAFGILYGSCNIAVQILFPDQSPIKDTTYRDALIRRSDRQQVRVEEFADLVRDNRPQWLIEYIEELHTQGRHSSTVMDRLQRFLDALKAQPERRDLVTHDGETEGEIVPDPEKDKPRPPGPPCPRPPVTPKPGIGRRVRETVGIPIVQFTHDPGLLEDMRGRAAMYRKEDNTVFLNPHHFRYLDDLEQLYEDVGPDAERRQVAREFYDEAYQFCAGRFVVQAWFYKGKAEWDDSAWEEALNMETLTIHLTSPESLQEAKTRLRQKLNTGRRRERNEP
jgi:hypothetical protein